MIRIALLLALVPTPALAQISLAPLPQVDVNSAVSAAVAAAMPPVCTTVPPADTYGGSTGTAAACTPRRDASRPTIVQSVRGTTASDGTWTVTWPAAFTSAPTYAHAEVLGSGAPYMCDVAAVTATGATGTCYSVVSATLPGLATSLLGFVVKPFGAASSMTVMVVGRL